MGMGNRFIRARRVRVYGNNAIDAPAPARGQFFERESDVKGAQVKVPKRDGAGRDGKNFADSIKLDGVKLLLKLEKVAIDLGQTNNR
jgi:hypothetical protein